MTGDDVHPSVTFEVKMDPKSQMEENSFTYPPQESTSVPLTAEALGSTSYHAPRASPGPAVLDPTHALSSAATHR